MVGENFGKLVTLRMKTLVNRNELSLTSSIRTPHAMLNLKTTIIYLIIMCSAKMVHLFAVSSVVRGYHKYKDVWSASIDRTELPCKREPRTG